MKLLYITDHYAEDVCGTKISIFRELKRNGINADIYKFKKVINVDYVVDKIKINKYTHVWIAHSWPVFNRVYNLKEINSLNAIVILSGFSDPNNWNQNKFDLCNIYTTNSKYIYNLYPEKAYYFPTACDLNFHKNLHTDRPVDILVYGKGRHPFFNPEDYRQCVVRKLIHDFPYLKFLIFGTTWDDIKCEPPKTGYDFIKAINQSKIGLDLEQDKSPPAHRVFELMSCGTVAITKERDELNLLFPTKDNIIYYNTYDDIVTNIYDLLYNDKYKNISLIMEDNTCKYHSIRNRVFPFLDFLKGRK